MTHCVPFTQIAVKGGGALEHAIHISDFGLDRGGKDEQLESERPVQAEREQSALMTHCIPACHIAVKEGSEAEHVLHISDSGLGREGKDVQLERDVHKRNDISQHE